MRRDYRHADYGETAAGGLSESACKTGLSRSVSGMLNESDRVVEEEVEKFLENRIPPGLPQSPGRIPVIAINFD
jgi:hypothetical protein